MDLTELISTYAPIIESQIAEGVKPEQLVAQLAPEFLRFIAEQSKQKDLTNKAAFIAGLAGHFVGHAIEVTESDDEARALARRAVRIASFITEEALRTVQRAAG